jgi:hypothetical protein
MALFVGLIEKLQAQSKSILALVLVLVSILVLRWIVRLRMPLPPTTPELYNGHTVFGSHQFSTSRANYLECGTKQSQNGQFSFWYGGNHVVVLSGESARTSFLTSRGLDPSAG